MREIAQMLGVGINRVERARQAAGGRERFAGKKRIDDAGAATLLALIRRHVPRTLDAALRDEVVAAISLAVLQGELVETDIGKATPGFISRGFATWSNKWGDKTIDAPLGDNDGRTSSQTGLARCCWTS